MEEIRYLDAPKGMEKRTVSLGFLKSTRAGGCTFHGESIWYEWTCLQWRLYRMASEEVVHPCCKKSENTSKGKTVGEQRVMWGHWRRQLVIATPWICVCLYLTTRTIDVATDEQKWSDTTFGSITIDDTVIYLLGACVLGSYCFIVGQARC